MVVNKIFNKKIVITSLIISSIIIFYNIINFYSIVEEKKDVCFKNLKIKLDNGISPIDIYNKDFNNLQYYVERSLIARSEMLKVGNKLRQNKIKPKERPILQIHIKKDNYNNIKTT